MKTVKLFYEILTIIVCIVFLVIAVATLVVIKRSTKK